MLAQTITDSIPSAPTLHMFVSSLLYVACIGYSLRVMRYVFSGITIYAAAGFARACIQHKSQFVFWYVNLRERDITPIQP